MRWPTHQVFGLGVGLLARLSPFGLVLVLVGAILPDLLDQCWAALRAGSRASQQKLFARMHRGISHWFGLWLMPLFFVRELPVWSVEAFQALCLGALTLLLLDALTPMGIPLLPLLSKPRLACPLCRTGSWTEGVIFLLLCFGLVLLLVQHFAAWPLPTISWRF